jgi:malate dehydrogenase
MERLSGTVMELEDSAFPLVKGIETSDDPNKAFAGADAVFLVGSRPRTKDMNRADLVLANGPIFIGQGRAINDHAAKGCKVLTVGNPCNTNALIAQRNAPEPGDRAVGETHEYAELRGQERRGLGQSLRQNVRRRPLGDHRWAPGR